MTPEQFYRITSPERVLELASAHPSPSYLWFRPIIERQLVSLTAALRNLFEIHYAVKANPHPDILSLMATLGVGADVASAGELRAAIDAGIPREKIEFSGPGKSFDELALAVRAKIGAINVESQEELELLESIATQQPEKVRIGLRVNPALTARAGLRMGGQNQFGIQEEVLPAVLEHAKRANMIDLIGLHVHVGSQILETDTILAIFRKTLDLSCMFAEATGRPVNKLNFGGGWGVPYFDGQAPLDLEALGQGIHQLLQKHSPPASYPTRLILEPGRFLVAESGLYVTRVLYRKRAADRTIAIVDGGMHHNYLLAGGMGQVIRRNFYWNNLTAATASPSTRSKVKLTIAGRLCTPQDILVSDADCAPDVEQGDYIAFFNCGAYGATASPMRFLSHTEPYEALVSS